MEDGRDCLSHSAFQDRRFEPIAAREVPSLRCSVSLLVCYETAAHAFDWVVGTHGILIKFQDKKVRVVVPVVRVVLVVGLVLA